MRVNYPVPLVGFGCSPLPTLPWKRVSAKTAQGSFPRREGPARLNQKTCEQCRALRYRLARGLAGKLLAGFFAIPSRRISILCDTMITKYVSSTQNDIDNRCSENDGLWRIGVSGPVSRQVYRPGGREPVRKNCERCGESFWWKPFGARVRTLCDQCLRKHVNIRVSRPRAEPIQPVQLRPDHLEQLPTRVRSGGLRSG